MKTPLLHLLCALLPLCAAAQIVSDTSASLSTLRHEPMQQWPAEADRTIQRDQADSIDALVDLARARHQLKPGDAEALALLQKALKLEPTHLGAALLLAEVYQSAAGDDAENMKKAERLLKRAVEYHPHAEEGWLRLAQLLEKDLRYDAAIRILADAILLNPTDAEIYRAFIDKSFWYSAESDMIFVLDSLTTLLSYSHPHLIAKAEALFRLNDVQKSKALLDSLRSFIYKDTKTHFYLLDAKVCFELFQDDAGLASYWKAVSAVTDSLDRRHFLHDLCYIMTSEEYANFSAPGDFQRYLALFWRRRDPDLATPANERIAEHYRRVHYARRNFRRYVPDRYNETLLERDHYHAGAMDPNSPDRTATLRNAGSGAWIKHGVEVKVGDDFINTLLSDAIYANRDLDDMGLIYVRHGEWDDWETATIDQYNVLQNRTVQYFQRGTRPEMLFHFVKGGDIRGWCIESLPHYYINRGRFDPRYARIENNAEMNRRSREFEFEELHLNEELIAETTRDAEIAVKTETTDYDPPGEKIALPMQFLYFKEKDKARLEWFYLLMGDRIGLTTSAEDHRIRLSKFIGLYDENWTEVLHEERDEEIAMDMRPENWRTSSMVQREQIVVPAGVLHCDIQIRDHETENVAHRRDTLRVPDFSTSLCMSDIILSGTIEPGADDSPFRLGDLAFRPHMFWAYQKDETVGIYLEVYNLSPLPSGKTSFDLTCTLKEKEKRQNLMQRLFRSKQEVSILNHYDGSARDERIYLNLEFEKQKSGLYDLIIQIVDTVSNEEIIKSVELELL